MNTKSKKALIVIDVQPAFLDDENRYIVDNIVRLLDHQHYDLYIEAAFHAEKGSIWDLQQHWTCPKGPETETTPALRDRLVPREPLAVLKETRSVFKGNADLLKIFREKGITEVHLVGLETNDCVLATAYEAFDLGFVPYVIEDCCETASTRKNLHELALTLLREQNMTKSLADLIGKQS